VNKNLIENIYPLSPVQQGMLFHTLLAPGSGVYLQQRSCTLHGPLEVAQFRTAWQRVFQRHAVLRTAFNWEHRLEPFQVVFRQAGFPWEQHDWRGLTETEQAERLEKLLARDREQGFELSRAPLTRLMLIQLADDVHRFIWSHHHLLLDGWSLSLVLKEVLTDYEALCRGESPNAIARRPYADYIAWLRQQDLAQAEAFWRQTLKGFRKPTSLGMPVYDSARLYDYRHMLMPAEVMSTLRRVARQHRITVNAFVRGAWALVLSRYSGESDVVFGATVSGRSAPLNDIESMVGLFINTIPVRVKVATDDSLIPWLKQLQAQQFEAQPYEYISLTQLQAWSEVPRGLPLFESNVVFENAPFDGNLLDRKEDLRVEDHLYLEQAHYPLSVVVMPGRRMFVRIIYDCRRFDAVAVDRMLEHLKVLLTQMAEQSEIRITGVEGQVVRTPEAALDTAQPKSDVAYVAPRTSVEEMTVNIWSEVLGIERVGVNDNFFDLGGHSLLAISVLSRVRNEFQIELQLRSIVDAPTPAELAMVIIQHLAEGIDDLQVQQILQELESVEAH